MEPPRWRDTPSQTPSFQSTQDTRPVSSSANLTEKDIIGRDSHQGWKLNEVMDARQAVAAAAALLEEDADRDDFLLKPWPPQKLRGVVSLDAVVAQQATIIQATSDHPAPRIGTRHKKRKGAAALKGPERQAQGLADLADMASMFTEPGSKRAKVGPKESMLGRAQEIAEVLDEPRTFVKPSLGQRVRKSAPRKQLQNLPYRRADGTWTCTFSTGGMNKDRLTLCSRDNEAKRISCKACGAPRWDWQLHARLLAILQHRDLEKISLQQVMQELTEMSLKNFEGLRFPKEAVEHEVAAFIAVRRQGAAPGLQPAAVSCLPVFPRGLWKGQYQAAQSRAVTGTRTEWAESKRDASEYEVSMEDKLSSTAVSATPALSSRGRCQISIEDELASGFTTLDSSSKGNPWAGGAEQSPGPGARQQKAKSNQWRPLYCALLRLADAISNQQPDQAAGSNPGRSSVIVNTSHVLPSNQEQPALAGAVESHGNSLSSSAEERAEDCCAFAHSLIEATLGRRWPSRLKLTKSMKGIQERLLRLHLPFPRSNQSEAPAAESAAAHDRAVTSEDSDSAERVQGVKRPLPSSSRAVLLQNPSRRPKDWSAPPLPPPRIKQTGEPLPPELPDTSSIEAASWLLAPPYALHQVQHAFAPSEAAMPGATEISSSDGPQADVSANNAQAEASAGRAKADGKDKMSKDEDGVPSFGQWGSAFRPAVVLAALPAPEGTQAPESMQGTTRQAGGKFHERAAIGEEGQSHDWAAQENARTAPEVVNYKVEWKRRLLQKLQQPDIQGLAGMHQVKHGARLVFQAAGVLGVRQEIIESAIRQFTALQAEASSQR